MTQQLAQHNIPFTVVFTHRDGVYRATRLRFQRFVQQNLNGVQGATWIKSRYMTTSEITEEQAQEFLHITKNLSLFSTPSYSLGVRSLDE